MAHFWPLDGAGVKANMLVYQGAVTQLTQGKGTAEERSDTISLTGDGDEHQLCIPARLNARLGDLVRAVYLYTGGEGQDGRVLAFAYNATWELHVTFEAELVAYFMPTAARRAITGLQILFWGLAIGCGVLTPLVLGHALRQQAAQLVIGLAIACVVISEGGIRGHYRRHAKRVLAVLQNQGYGKISLAALHPY